MLTKFSPSDLAKILRQFQLASDTSSPQHIESVIHRYPTPHTIVVSFLYNRRGYYAVQDHTLDDDPAAAEQFIHAAWPHVRAEVVSTPDSQPANYALSFKGKSVYLFAITPTKQRLDLVFTQRHPELSRSTLQKYIKAGRVSVNEIVQTSPSHEVSETDSLAISFPETRDYSTHALPIIYLDDHVIVINKPAGVLTHSKGTLEDEFTVAEFFRRYTTVGLDTNRPGIVHRLDRDTSGVMIGARTDRAAHLLKKQFAARTVRKVYFAIVKGTPEPLQAKLELPIGRHPNAPSTFRVDAGGKSAVTDYRVIKEQDGYSLVELRPSTGRTHQLRVHLAYLGTPIVGDRVYGTSGDRLYLHATSLQLTLPSGQSHTFTAPLPPEFSTYFPEESRS